MPDPIEGAGKIGKSTVDLGFIGGVNQSSHGRSGWESESQEVSSEEEGVRCVLLDLKPGGGLEEGEDSRRGHRRSGRTTTSIRGHDDGEVLDGFGDEALGEAPDGAIGGILAVGHVLGDQRADALDQVQGQTETGEEGFHQEGTLLFVTWGDDA